MIEKYYNGAVEQVIAGLSNTSHNHILVRYSGDFSIRELESVTRARTQANFYFAEYEFCQGEIAGAYEPYLSIICEMFRRYHTGSFADFLEECDVYYLHRPVFLSYFEHGFCRRVETILLDEVTYEQERMAGELQTMLRQLSRISPVVILLNRFQYAARSTMALTYRLLCEENKNMGLVFGVNDLQSIPEFLMPEWDAIYEKLDDGSRSYHIGNFDSGREKPEQKRKNEDTREEAYRKLNNMAELLDFEQAAYLLGGIERRIKLDNYVMPDTMRYRTSLLFAKISIFRSDISKALEICESFESLNLGKLEAESRFEHDHLLAMAFMYQGKLTEALEYAKKAGQTAREMQDEYRVFQAELLEAQIQMSGWYNIFFCAQDVEVSDHLIEKLMFYNFKNHLAHMYVYAYDNKPEIVAKAYRSEELLIYFSRGIKIAKQIGNEQLVHTAYQKNIMLASTNGMHEISLLYSVRTYEALKNRETIEAGRIYSGIAYNLCAVGENERAKHYYNEAIRLFYRLRCPEDIAEVQYNMSLNCIMCGEYEEAEIYLMQCMKAIEKLHLNSLRVCNLSKLYGLLALVTILQGNRFNCERYLYSCRQFLNYVLEKEKIGNDLGAVHDYARVDDDMFLYTFSNALLAYHDGNEEHAAALYEKAEEYLKRSEGNQFYSYALFRKSRMECFLALGKKELCAEQETALAQYEKSCLNCLEKNGKGILNTLPMVSFGQEGKEISLQELDELLWQESMVLAYKSKKKQLDFISTWQKLIDVTGVCAEQMMDTVMRTFLNHFNVDCAVYVRYIEKKPQVLYNNTGKKLSITILEQMEHALRQSQSGFAISKISSNYAKHQDITSLFGEDDVCSMVAVPFFNNAKMESFLITYVLMKDNWHSSVNRYMLDEDDLNMYQLLFREVRYSLNRLDAYDKIYEMNTKLYLSAVTDQLTGIYNRAGFYQKISEMLPELKSGDGQKGLGLMFVDLDNFKHYNDTFGHDAGDLILQRMAEIFQEVCRGQGFVCRYGGDEFILVFSTADKKKLEKSAQQIYRAIELAGGFEKEISEKTGQHVQIGEKERISCSIGVVAADCINDEEEINRMVKQADDLLYTIKTTTKGTYRI